MPVETHRCDVCGNYKGEHDEVREHVLNEHDVNDDEVDEYIQPLEDRGV